MFFSAYTHLFNLCCYYGVTIQLSLYFSCLIKNILCLSKKKKFNLQSPSSNILFLHKPCPSFLLVVCGKSVELQRKSNLTVRSVKGNFRVSHLAGAACEQYIWQMTRAYATRKAEIFNITMVPYTARKKKQKTPHQLLVLPFTLTHH